jgi:hypothetical protein
VPAANAIFAASQTMYALSTYCDVPQVGGLPVLLRQ